MDDLDSIDADSEAVWYPPDELGDRGDYYPPVPTPGTLADAPTAPVFELDGVIE
jgi:hypothetical protein